MGIFGRSLCFGLLLATAGVSLAAPQQATTAAQAATSSDAGASFSNAALSHDNALLTPAKSLADERPFLECVPHGDSGKKEPIIAPTIADSPS